VVSTALDMGRWLAAQAPGGGPVLRPGDVALMQTPPPGVAGGYAMGWQVVAPGRLAHTGVLSTYSAIQVLLPGSGQGFVLLFNGSNALADTAGLAAGLADLLTGGTEPPGPRSTALVAAALGAAAVAVLALRVRQLARVPPSRCSPCGCASSPGCRGGGGAPAGGGRWRGRLGSCSRRRCSPGCPRCSAR